MSIKLSFKDNTSEQYNYTGKLPIIYTKNSSLFIPFGIAIYLILIFVRSFVNSKLKWYMDLKYVSPNKLLIYYGIIGASVCFLVSFISSFKECDSTTKYSYEHDKAIFAEYICKVNKTNICEIINDSIKNNIFNINFLDNKTNNETLFKNTSHLEHTQYYFENFLLYFQKFNGIEILKEFSIIILGMIFFFFDKYFSILVIKNLTPVHITFTIPIIYIIQKFFMVLNTLIIDQKYFKTDDRYKWKKYFCDFVGDFFSIFGFLIYLEIIVLKIFSLDYNIRANITRRSFGESYGINKKPINANENDNDNDDNDNEERSFASEEVEQEEGDIDLVYS